MLPRNGEPLEAVHACVEAGQGPEQGKGRTFKIPRKKVAEEQERAGTHILAFTARLSVPKERLSSPPHPRVLDLRTEASPVLSKAYSINFLYHWRRRVLSALPWSWRIEHTDPLYSYYLTAVKIRCWLGRWFAVSIGDAVFT